MRLTRGLAASVMVLAALAAACERPTAPILNVFADRNVDVPAYSAGWRDVSVGGAHACGIRTDGTVACWGSNASGQLGIASSIGRCGARFTSCETAPRVIPLLRARRVSAGAAHSCAIDVDGVLYCWGDNSQVQLGVERVAAARVPVAVAPELRFMDVSAGVTHSCAVRTNGVAYCWGEGYLGGLGRGDSLTSVFPRPVAGDARFLSVSAGQWRSCGVALDAQVWCWGAEWEGSGGAFDFFGARLVPERARAPLSRSVTVSVTSICGVALDGSGWCYEGNAYGQLGLGTETGTALPTLVDSPERWQGLSAGIVQSCGVADGGRAFCWGNGTFGQLGIPRTGDVCGPARLECARSPAPVFGGLRFDAVATGPGNHVCGITTASAMMCWGLGGSGQLGDGWTRDRQSLPVGVLAPRS